MCSFRFLGLWAMTSVAVLWEQSLTGLGLRVSEGKGHGRTPTPKFPPPWNH